MQLSSLIETTTRTRLTVLAESLNRAQVALAQRGDPQTGKLAPEDLNAFLDLAKLRDICLQEDAA